MRVVLAMADEGGSSFDLIHLNGPLTVEAILRTLQQRFVDGQCYVSTWDHLWYLQYGLV